MTTNRGDEAEVSSVTVEGEVVRVYVNEQGQVVAVDSEGIEEVVAEQVPQEGEVLAVEDSQGNSFTVDSEGSVSSGDALAGDSPTNNAVDIKQELIKEALDYFKEEINIFLENQDKGPLEEALVYRLLDFPDCLPEEEAQLEAVLARIEDYLEDTEALLNLIKEDDANKARIEELTAKLTGKQPPYVAGLTETEWNELIEMICPYLVEEKERPDLVTIEPITDELFAPGIDSDKLEIKYSVETTKRYPLSYAKFEIYREDGKLVYVSDLIEIKINNKEQWDGKMNQGERSGDFIRHDDGKFTIKVSAATGQDFGDQFEANTTAQVDEDADKWRDFDHQDIGVASDYWSFDTFKGLKTEYETSLEEISDEHPLDYLNESLVLIEFLGQGPFLLNIRFGYVLKLFEQSLPTSKRSEYESFLNTVSFDSKLRMTPLGSGVSNHALGFALDLDAPENPMITDAYLYHFIEFVTGIESFYGRRERTNSFIDELKSTHNTFVDRLKVKSDNPVAWEDLIESAEKIEAFENREPDSETFPLYFLADVAGNIPLDDLEVIRMSIENLNDANIKEEEITEICNKALANLKLIETQITSLQSIATEYEEGMFRKYFASTELTALKEYLAMAVEQIKVNRTNIHELKEYIALNDVEQLSQDFLNYLNRLFEDEEEPDNFEGINELNGLNNHIVALYEGFENLSSSLGSYKNGSLTKMAEIAKFAL